MNNESMQPIPEHILNEILPDILEGNADENSIRIWDEWMHSDPLHQQWFDDMKRIWTSSSQETSPISADDSWKQLLLKKQQFAKGGFKITYQAMAIAASVLIILGFGIWYQMNKQPSAILYSFQDKKELQLPDQSIIYSPGSALIEYPESFNGATREITQKQGMAFFEITKNPQQPFIIHSNVADIRVVGTSFRTQVSTDSLEVIVATGKVAVYHENDTVMITPGEKVVFYHSKPNTGVITNTDQNFIFWKTNFLEYKDAPLDMVLSDLQEKLRCKISFDENDIKGKHLSGKYRCNSIESILQAIAETLDLNVRNENNNYIIELK